MGKTCQKQRLKIIVNFELVPVFFEGIPTSAKYGVKDREEVGKG